MLIIDCFSLGLLAVDRLESRTVSLIVFMICFAMRWSLRSITGNAKSRPSSLLFSGFGVGGGLVGGGVLCCNTRSRPHRVSQSIQQQKTSTEDKYESDMTLWTTTIMTIKRYWPLLFFQNSRGPGLSFFSGAVSLDTRCSWKYAQELFSCPQKCLPSFLGSSAQVCLNSQYVHIQCLCQSSSSFIVSPQWSYADAGYKNLLCKDYWE